MSVVRKYGKPDYFLTMTANPSWPEVTAALRPGEQAHHRPDLVARVFHQKLHALLADLLDNHVLGVVVAYTWVIEFQKRGLPHTHILLIVRAADKPKTPEDVDQRICAELPDAKDPQQAQLRRIILASQIHGPCGVRNPKAPCMTGKDCIKKYPKDFQEITLINDNGYPSYRRREDSPTATKGIHTIDARDVVPYNPYLSKKYACHLNLEFCGTIKAVKYLYKYTYKGHDRASLEFEVDEIKAFVDARYVGPPEATWRIFGFHMHGKSHNVERLAVHLPFKQRVAFASGTEREALEKAARRNTTLTAWFTLNAKTTDHHALRYAEIPEHFTWQKTEGQWKLRQRSGHSNRVIGRLFGAQPTEGERFYLYLLLLHVPSAISFDFLKSFAGEQLSHFS